MERSHTAGGYAARRAGRLGAAPAGAIRLALLALAVVTVLAFPASAAAVTPSFSVSTYAAGAGATWAAPHDVTGDGALDLVVCNGIDDNVMVFAGDGAGGFSLLNTFASGGDRPYGLTVAELTGDGIDDLAVVNRGSHTLTIFTGDGAGGFTLLARPNGMLDYVLGTEPIDVKAVDLDGDEDMDLVCSAMWNTYVSPFYNNGTGRFTRIDVMLPDKGGTVLGVGDLNEDARPDVAVAQYWGTAEYLLFGDESGTLQHTGTLEVGPYPQGADFSDFDGDGHQDIVVTTRYPNNAAVFLGDGTGAFTGPANFGVGQYAKLPIAVDLNVDSAPDIVTCNYGNTDTAPWSNTLSILTGVGDGTFDPQVTVDVGGKPHSVQSADFNDDGLPDLVSANYATGDISVLINTTPVTPSDKVPPVTTCSADSAWHKSPVTVTLSAYDAGSGVAYTEYRLDGGAWTKGTSVVVGAHGTHTLQYRSVDKADNVEPTKSAQVKVDAIAPVTSDDADSEWHASATTVEFTATDAGSGVAETHYSIDGGPDTIGGSATVSAPTDHSKDGLHTIAYWSVDKVGNVEDPAGVCQVRIDTTAPVTDDDAPSGWQDEAVTVHFDASDAASGVEATSYRLDDGSWTVGDSVDITTEGVHTLRYRSTDVAGNQEEAKEVEVKLDWAAPVTLAAPDDALWHPAPVSVALTATDAGGVDYTEYNVDGGPWVRGDDPTLLDDGTHTIQFRSSDLAGHLEQTRSVTVQVDALPPTTVATGDTRGWHNHAAVIALTPTDAGGGVANTSYSIDGGDWRTGVAIVVPDEGAHTIAYRSADVFDHVEGDQTLTVGVDTKRPSTRAPSPASVRRYHRVTLRYSVVDRLPSCGKANATITIRTLKGVVKKRIRLLGVATNKPLTKSFLCKLPKGTYLFSVAARDIAGNRGVNVARNSLIVR